MAELDQGLFARCALIHRFTSCSCEGSGISQHIFAALTVGRYPLACVATFGADALERASVGVVFKPHSLDYTRLALRRQASRSTPKYPALRTT